MSTRPLAPLTPRNISFLFRHVFKEDHVEVKEHKNGGLTISHAAYFNGEAAPRYVESTLSDLWDAALTDRIATKLHEHSNS